MYRAATWAVLNRGLKPNDASAVSRLVDSLTFQYCEGRDGIRIWVNGREVTADIRSPEVTRAVTPVCEISHVRERLVSLQRRWAERGLGVLEGRDTGTVVMPDARLKIYLTARPEVRAHRRARELGIAEDAAKVAALTAEIAERDRRNVERELAPLLQTPDMIELDTSNLPFEEQVNRIIRLAAERFGFKVYGAAGNNR
jgi:cytidylate kinase